MLRDVVARLRAVMVALHPTVLAYGGLDAALRAVAAQQSAAGGFEVEVEVDPAAIGPARRAAAVGGARAADQRRPPRARRRAWR